MLNEILGRYPESIPTKTVSQLYTLMKKQSTSRDSIPFYKTTKKSHQFRSCHHSAEHIQQSPVLPALFGKHQKLLPHIQNRNAHCAVLGKNNIHNCKHSQYPSAKTSCHVSPNSSLNSMRNSFYKEYQHNKIISMKDEYHRIKNLAHQKQNELLNQQRTRNQQWRDHHQQYSRYLRQSMEKKHSRVPLCEFCDSQNTSATGLDSRTCHCSSSKMSSIFTKKKNKNNLNGGKPRSSKQNKKESTKIKMLRKMVSQSLPQHRSQQKDIENSNQTKRRNGIHKPSIKIGDSGLLNTADIPLFQPIPDLGTINTVKTFVQTIEKTESQKAVVAESEIPTATVILSPEAPKIVQHVYRYPNKEPQKSSLKSKKDKNMSNVDQHKNLKKNIGFFKETIQIRYHADSPEGENNISVKKLELVEEQKATKLVANETVNAVMEFDDEKEDQAGLEKNSQQNCQAKQNENVSKQHSSVKWKLRHKQAAGEDEEQDEAVSELKKRAAKKKMTIDLGDGMNSCDEKEEGNGVAGYHGQRDTSTALSGTTQIDLESKRVLIHTRKNLDSIPQLRKRRYDSLNIRNIFELIEKIGLTVEQPTNNSIQKSAEFKSEAQIGNVDETKTVEIKNEILTKISKEITTALEKAGLEGYSIAQNDRQEQRKKKIEAVKTHLTKGRIQNQKLWSLIHMYEKVEKGATTVKQKANDPETIKPDDWVSSDFKLILDELSCSYDGNLKWTSTPGQVDTYDGNEDTTQFDFKERIALLDQFKATVEKINRRISLPKILSQPFNIKKEITEDDQEDDIDIEQHSLSDRIKLQGIKKIYFYPGLRITEEQRITIIKEYLKQLHISQQNISRGFKKSKETNSDILKIRLSQKKGEQDMSPRDRLRRTLMRIRKSQPVFYSQLVSDAKRMSQIC